MNEAIDDPNRIESDMVDFTDEEGYGRFLDMHLLFASYLNLKGVKVCINGSNQIVQML
jgi:splicing factor 3A subunit 3